VKKFKFGIDMLTLFRIIQLVDAAMAEARKPINVPIVPGRPEQFGK
jgi:hypothetical protein